MTDQQATSLEAYLGRESATRVPPSIQAVAEAARLRHGAPVLAILFYGSCLRDGGDEGKIVDLYLLVSGYREALGNPVSAALARLLPPNVYYIETDFDQRCVRAKYAVLAFDQFLDAGSGGRRHPFVWTRFAQPTAIAYLKSEELRQPLVAALAGAVRTSIDECLPLLDESFDAAGLWQRLFEESYRTELRAEGPERARKIVEAFDERYRQVTALVLDDGGGPKGVFRHHVAPAERRRCARRWMVRRLIGKPLNVLRLLKAAFTFQGGARYLAWKIERHSGVKVELTPWQERHPILASSVLFWRLYRKGAFR
jgi:predicted nucleotidyltransferase